MLEDSLLKLFIVLFAFITWRKLDLGLFFLFLLLPSYLIRFKFAGLPSTLLEAMVLVIFLFWLGDRFVKLDFKNQAKTLKKIFQNNFSLLLASILFLTGATVSIFTSIDLRAALGEWKAFYIEPFLLFIILITHLKTKKQIDNILVAILIGGLLTTLLSIYQHFTGWMVPWEYWENNNTFRVTGWYGFPNGVGLFLPPIFPIALYLFKTAFKKRETLGNYVIVLLSALFIILSPLAVFYAKSTGGLIGILSGVILLFIINKKTRLATLALALMGIAFIIFLPAENNIRQELFLQDRSGQLRLNMWAETIEFIGDRPILGAGLASYKTLIYPYRIDKWVEVFHHPHNIFLTMWVNIGFIGLIGFTWIAVWFTRVALMNSDKTLVKFLLATMAVFMTTGLVDSPYIKNDMAILFWLLPALLIVAIEIKKTK